MVTIDITNKYVCSDLVPLVLYVWIEGVKYGPIYISSNVSMIKTYSISLGGELTQ